MIYYTADLHLFHTKVAQLRGFESAEAWTRHIDGELRAVLRPKDHLWILGDMTAGGQIPAMLEVVAGWPGVKHLVAGNHDPVGPHNRDAHRYQRRYLEVFDSVASLARRRINGVDALLSHYPYDGDHTQQTRYEAYRLRDAGIPLLHGHTHQGEQITRSVLTGAPQIHVGWDSWHQLVTADQIAALMA